MSGNEQTARFEAQTEHQIAEGIFRVSLDPTLVIDGDGIIRRFNAAAESAFGYAAEEVIGRNVAMFVPEPHHSRHDDYIRAYLGGGEPGVIGRGREVEALRRDGSRFPAHLSVTQVEVAGTPLFVGTLRDLTARKEQEAAIQRHLEELDTTRGEYERQAGEMAGLAEELHMEKERVEEAKRIIERQATHDPLTDLGNRARLSRRLPELIAEAEKTGAAVLLAYVDLDNFKPVNDILGHDAGDNLLCEVAGALTSAAGDSGEVFRLGGDEFAVLARLDGTDPRAEAEALAARVLDALAIPIQAPDHVIETGASLGLALLPGDAETGDALLTAGDNAMYRAKHAGKGQFRW